ncbi:ABC transporter permease [Conexibacter arvalis]|uniref:Putative ABC transport system permease protein n=1 Tax=Conexibacter arvalis TaxID=912552 RepID=A0A840IJ48_9ACTN|nr:ABC transporter permease [Conexibacter arvalis]MBB4664769.1 putative ABC transport system permease protein [Conexibacter arvalis]
MKLRTLIYIYRWRLRAHPVQELLAAAGIAAGVALLFAVQVANTSITGSVERLFRGIAGDAQIQVAGGDEHGTPAGTVRRIRAIEGVTVAAPVVERRAILVGPEGRQPLELVGVEPSLAALRGRLTQNFSSSGLQLPRRGIVLPAPIAEQVGVTAPGRARLLVAGTVHDVAVAATLGDGQIGDASASPVAIAALPFAQRLAGMDDRVSSIFVAAKLGATDAVTAQLEQLGAGRLDVAGADAPVERLRVATEANDQSTLLFSIVSALVGLLFAFNAMLLTVPDRRRFVAELRTQGATTRQVVSVLAFQALALGTTASLVGLLLGDLLSRTVFNSVPGYLAFTFPIGTQRIVPVSAIAIAFGAGLLAALLATGRPLRDAFSRGELEAVYDEDGEPGEAIPPRTQLVLLGVAGVLVAATAAMVALEPSLAIVGVLVLIVATLCAMPASFTGAMHVIDWIATRLRLKLLTIAVMSARSTMTRSVAIASIAAIALLGNLAIEGARQDLVRGLHAGYADHLRTADVWITTAGRSLTTDSFHASPAMLRRLADVPGVEDVRVYQGGMYDTGDRRIWMIARPRADRVIVPLSQVIDGDAARATQAIRDGGAAAVSDAIAKRRDLGVGDRLTLPTPSGELSLDVAAIVTNLSWGPGAVILNADDYRDAWQTADPSAIQLDLAPDTAPGSAIRAIETVLGAQAPALDVQTTAELEAEFQGVLREGLTRLSQIATLLLIASALALAAAMSAAVWERRRLLAAYKLEGVQKRQIGGMLLLEGLAILAIGCATGIAAGIYGHLLGNRWLELTTGFPAPFSLQIPQAAELVALVVALTLLIVAIPGFLATRVPPRLRFQE